ncbi:MAG: hypothetical protein ACE5R6_12600 [Candidatus Heimdallarchaeota archaeon]
MIWIHLPLSPTPASATQLSAAPIDESSRTIKPSDHFSLAKSISNELSSIQVVSGFVIIADSNLRGTNHLPHLAIILTDLELSFFTGFPELS